MKIFLTIIALFLVFSTTVYGKLITGYGFKVGVVRANQEYSNLSDSLADLYSYIQSFDWRTGFGIVGYLEWFANHPLSAVTEIGYVQKGFIGEPEGVFESGGWHRVNPLKINCRLDYLVLTFLVKPSLHNKYISPYLIAGPRFDIILPWSLKKENYHYERINLGGDIGGGIEFSLGKSVKMLSEFRYCYTFTDSYKIDDPTLKVNLNRKNKSYQILFGLKF